MISTVAMAALAGFAGSAHCAGMCGGLSLALRSRTVDGVWGRWWSQAGYHLGRLNTYVGLGAGAGAAGVAWMAMGPVAVMGRAAALLVGGLMIWMGLEQLRLVAPRSQRPLGHVYRTLTAVLRATTQTSSALAPVALGVLNAFLPCHLLASALGLAAASGSVGGGMTTMLGFGCGTVPALLGVGVLSSRWGRATTERLGQVGAALLVVTGIVTVARAFAEICWHVA